MLKITLQIKFDKRWIRLVSFSQRGFCVIKTCIHCGKLYQSFYHHEKCIWYQPNINQLKTSFFKVNMTGYDVSVNIFASVRRMNKSSSGFKTSQSKPFRYYWYWSTFNSLYLICKAQIPKQVFRFYSD